MAKNLPNYYIILRVQHNASVDTIKASYRTLMVTMKMHPDLGGDHDVAAQINEAYAVLKDESKRVKYDRLYLLQRIQAAQTAARERAKRTANSAGARPAAGSTGRPSPAPQAREGKAGQCPYCNAALPKLIRPDMRCERCRSPLYASPKPGAFGRELFGRRATPRIVKSHFATIHPIGQAQSMTVKMRDLSLTGISFYSDIALEIDQVFKFRDATLEAIAVVVSRGKRGQWYSVHARLLTVAFHQTGVFVSASQ
ncbi:MAG: DnaJ domain-containing protein [Candidatus Binatia bacterium]